MPSWEELAAAAPGLADRVQTRFAASRHNLLATLRRDGAPRLSGVEVQFALGQLWVGMMGGSRKAVDLRGDRRLALHSAPIDLDLVDGDAKVAGSAEEILDEARAAGWAATLPTGPPTPFHLFRVEVGEVSIVRVEVDRLVIDAWRPDRGVWRVERA